MTNATPTRRRLQERTSQNKRKLSKRRIQNLEERIHPNHSSTRCLLGFSRVSTRRFRPDGRGRRRCALGHHASMDRHSCSDCAAACLYLRPPVFMALKCSMWLACGRFVWPLLSVNVLARLSVALLCLLVVVRTQAKVRRLKSCSVFKFVGDCLII